MADLYSIRNWGLHFESAQSRKCRKLSWFRCPNKHDGKGFRRIMNRQDGPELFAAWVLIVQVASKCHLRGTLADDKPLTAEDLHFKTGAPIELFERALEVFSSDAIGWLVVARSQSTTTTLPADYQPDTTPLPIDKTRQEETREEENVCLTDPKDISSKSSNRTVKGSAGKPEGGYMDPHLRDKLARKVAVSDPADIALLDRIAEMPRRGLVSENVVIDSAEATAFEHRDNPIGYFRRCCQNKDPNFEGLLSQVPEPKGG